MDKFDARQATLDLVTAFVNNNSLKSQELPALLSEVYGAIAGFGGKMADPAPQGNGSAVPQDIAVSVPDKETVAEAASIEPKAAISIEESLSDPNYLVSMITGEKMKTLARHLRSHGLDEEQYRERYQLPQDYPMVAPAYSEFRRSVAKKMSLGKVGRTKPAKDLAAEVAASAKAAPVKTKEVAKALSKKPSSGKQITKSTPKRVASKADTPPFAPPAPKAEPKRQGKGAIKKVKADTPVSTPTNVQAPSSAAPSVETVDTAAKVATVKPVKSARKARSKGVSPDASPATASVKRKQVRPAASEVLQKSDEAAAAPVKTRRSKLTPVFSD